MANTAKWHGRAGAPSGSWLGRRARELEQEDRDLFVWDAAAIDAAMRAITGHTLGWITAQPTPEASSSLPPPASLLIQTVPFTIQAPFEKWDPAHEEYCEAAVVYMVGQYLSGDRRGRIPPAPNAVNSECAERMRSVSRISSPATRRPRLCPLMTSEGWPAQVPVALPPKLAQPREARSQR
jgi:hypothetical protein